MKERERVKPMNYMFVFMTCRQIGAIRNAHEVKVVIRARPDLVPRNPSLPRLYNYEFDEMLFGIECLLRSNLNKRSKKH